MLKEGLQPQINRIDCTTGFTGRIEIEQVREDILETGVKLLRLILWEEAAGVVAHQITSIIID